MKIAKPFAAFSAILLAALSNQAQLFVILSCAALTVLPAHAQAMFQNLGFESATFSGSSSGGLNFQTIGQELPSWNGSIGGVPVSQVLQNNTTTGAASIDVLGPGRNTVGPGIIDGNYTVFLQAFNTGQGNVSLWQDGTIPANAQSLQFSAWQYAPDNQTFSVSFAGNSLSPLAIGSGLSPSGQACTVYGVNIEAYAGNTGQLEFTAVGGQGPDWIELDDITFSPTAVPEPSTLALILMGGLALAVRRWRAKGS